jgi:hypothetical protein
MKHPSCRIAAAVAVVALASPAAAVQADGEAAPAWELALTAYPTDVRGGENYTSAIATANRGVLHLELRVNYESIGARSAFVGWNFSGGQTVTWKLTPLLGGAWGTTQAVVPGVEASLGWRSLDCYIEAEYVSKREGRDDSYLYAWSELGWSAREWLRLGLAAQRTRAYESDRDLQRGPFVQLKWKPVTIGAYWFNPGSSEQVLVGMVGLSW